MKLRATIFLLVVCLGMGGYIYFVERKGPTSDQLMAQGKRVFMGFKSEEIQKFKLWHKEGEISCEKKSGSPEEWQITEPLAAKADRYAVDQILTRLEFLEKNRSLGKSALTEYDLAEPQAKITFWTKDKSHSLLIGAKSPVGNQVYAKLGEGDEIFLVEAGVEVLLKKKVADLRDRKLLTASLGQVNQITLKNSSRTLTFKKAEKGNWQIVEPQSLGADRTKMEEYIKNWLSLEASEFVQETSQDLSNFGLDPPQVELSVWGEGQTEPQKLLLGNSPQGRSEVYAKLTGEPNIVLVASEVSQWIKKEILELRDKHLFSFDKDKLTRLEWTQNKTTWRFEKKEGSWKLIEPQGKTVTEARIKDALAQLEEISFLRLVSDKPQSECFPEESKMELKAWDQTPEPILILTIGKKLPDSPEYYAKTKDPSETYVVSAGSVGVFLALTVIDNSPS